jgi:sugar/nucleoside kinase (ribokinase family)
MPPPAEVGPAPVTFVVVGDAMMDVTVRMHLPLAYGSDTPADIVQSPGGSAANTAAWLGRSGHRTVFVGAVGDDPAGEAVTRALSACGVETAVGRGAAPTGTCVVLVDPTGERSMLPATGANADLDPHGADPYLGPDGHLHVSGYALMHAATAAPVLDLIVRARAAGSTVSVDPASADPLRRGAPHVVAALEQADVILANEDEAIVLAGAPDPALIGRPEATVVVKRGAEGIRARRGQQRLDQSAPPCRVVDTTGAGDAFAAGFLPAWRAGLDLAEAAAAGQALAAEVVARVGAAPPSA